MAQPVDGDEAIYRNQLRRGTLQDVRRKERGSDQVKQPRRANDGYGSESSHCSDADRAGGFDRCLDPVGEDCIALGYAYVSGGVASSGAERPGGFVAFAHASGRGDLAAVTAGDACRDR